MRALEQALRSDYSHFLSGEAWGERTFALGALARIGKFDPAYGNELARRGQFLGLEGIAGVVTAFERAGQSTAPALAPLAGSLWRRSRNGRSHAVARGFGRITNAGVPHRSSRHIR